MKIGPLSVVLICLIALEAHATTGERWGRYSVAGLAGEGVDSSDPLAVPVDREFTGQVQTVQDALDQLLIPSGYRLASLQASCPSLPSLLGWPLPAMHRHVQAERLDMALQHLVGPTHYLVVDPVHRLISFELREPYASQRVASGLAMRLPAMRPLEASKTLSPPDPVKPTPSPRRDRLGPIATGTPLHVVADAIVNDYDATREQLMVGLFQDNPVAFCYHNLNCLRSGSTMRRPDEAFLPDHPAAHQIMRRQTAAWRARSYRTRGKPTTSQEVTP